MMLTTSLPLLYRCSVSHHQLIALFFYFLILLISITVTAPPLLLVSAILRLADLLLHPPADGSSSQFAKAQC